MPKKEFGGIILNPGCLNNCVFCQPKRASQKEILKQEEGILKNLNDFKKQGIEKIEISGSDPIEYEKIVPLIKFIKKQGFKYVQLSTHGRQLSDPLFALAVMKAGVNRLRIPLYGSHAEIHDVVTRAKGSFRDAVKGIKWLKKYTPGVEIQVSSLVMKQNKNDLVGLVKLIKKLKITDFYISIPMLSNKEIYSCYLPLKNLTPYILKAYKFAAKIKFPIKFMEIPFCVFGFKCDLINNSSKPPDLGKYCQPPEIHRSKIKDLPVYRLKVKADFCRHCILDKCCDGLPANDSNKYGTGKLTPVKK